MTLRWLSLATMAATLLLLFTACARQDVSAEIRFAIAQAPLTLDPRYATDAASERVNRLIYRPLVDFDAHSRPVPALASWNRPDALHCRFSLGQAGRRFHDGSKLTADDVVATYQSLLALKDSPHSAEFANIAAVAAVDADTVDFTLKAPDEQFPARLIIGILPASLIAQHHDFARHPVGSGPLRVVEWNRTLRLERIADRQRITLEEVRDPTVRVLKLLRGEADLLQGDLPPELVAYLKRQSNVTVQAVPGTNFSYLGFNLQDPLLNNPLVRRAVTLAGPQIVRARGQLPFGEGLFHIEDFGGAAQGPNDQRRKRMVVVERNIGGDPLLLTARPIRRNQLRGAERGFLQPVVKPLNHGGDQTGL